MRLLCEKVVHHPTIIAAIAEGAGWTLQGDAEVKSKFWGRSIELIPEGVLTVCVFGVVCFGVCVWCLLFACV